MRKFLQLFALAMLIASGWVTNAQNSTLTICNGTANHEYVPFYGFYADEDQHNQMIYPADSLTAMQGQAIMQMVFYIDQTASNGSYTSADRMGIWTVSLGTTSATTLNGLDNTTPLEEVYEGYFDCSTGTLTLLFESAFIYNGGNLLVDLQHYEAGYNRWYFLGVNATGASYCYNSQRNFLPKVQFTYGNPPTCFRVQSISASNILNDGMTINWVDTLNASTTYTISYWTNNAGLGDTVVLYSINGFSYTLSGLDANTLYNFSIIPDCSDGSVMPRTGSFKTDCDGGSCTITVLGTDSYGDGWNGNAINIYQAGALAGSVTIAGGNSVTGLVSVCKGDTVTVTYTSGMYPSEMGGTVIDGGGAVVFTIENMGNYANGAVLATIANACPDCLAPTNLTDSLDADGNVVLTWNSSAQTFMVYAGDSLYNDAVSDTSYTFIGLAASSVHQLGVAAICDGGDTSSISRHTVVTPCGAIEALPWSTGFENDEPYEAPLCWTVLRSVDDYGYEYPYVYAYTTHSGNRSLYFSTSYDDDTNLIVSSPIAINPGNLHVKFWLYSSMSNGSTFEAGLMTDTSDMSTFISLFLTNNTSSNYVMYNYSQYEFFSETTGLEDGDTAYLAFRMTGPDGVSYGDYAYIDDISMSAIPNCRMPLSGSGAIDSVGYSSARFSWDGTSETGYDLMLVHYEYGANGNVTDTVEEHFFSDTTFITVNTLLANTEYSAYVATICDIDGETDTTDYLEIGNFETQLRCYPVYQASLATLTTNAATINWNYRSNLGIAGIGAIVTLTDLSDAATTPTTQTITGVTSVTYTGLATGHTYSVSLTSLCGSEDTADTRTIYFTTHAPECAQAFTAAQVGSDNSTSTPIYGYNNYSYSQVIYSDAIINGLDTLTGVAYDAYNYSNEYMGVNSYEVDMYIGYVDTSDLTYYNGDYYLNNCINVDSTMTKVATGSLMTATGNGWVYMPFDTPFAVAPQDNAKRLLVTVVNHTLAIENNSNSWRCKYDYAYDANYNYYYKSRYYYGDTPFNPAAISASYSTSYVPNIQFFGNCGGSCLAPSVTMTGVNSNSVSLSWLPNGSETSWRVEYKLSTDTAWTIAATVTTNTYTVSGLAANSDYEVRVGAICTDEVSYATISFSTPCATVSIPYTHTFFSADPCWTCTQSYYTTLGVNIYSNYYLISPELPTPLSDLMIVITDRCYGTSASNQGYYVAIGDANGQNLTIIDTVYATEGTAVGTHTVYLSNYTGNGQNIYIAPTNGDFYIQSITVDLAPHCLPATNLTVDSVSLNTIGLSWTSDASSFQVSYRADGDTGAWTTLTVTTPHVVLTGLTPSTSYNVEVRPVCADNTLSTAVSDLVGTSCVTYNTPYNQTYFYNIPICWSTYYTSHPNTTWEQSVANGYGYIYSEASGNTTPVNDWLMSPEIVIPATAAADSIMLVYQIAGQPDSYASASSASYIVLATTNGGNSTTDFTDTLFSESVNSTTFDYRRIPLSQYAGDTVRFAFRSTCANYGLIAMMGFGVRSVLMPMYGIDGDNSVFTGETKNYSAVYIEGDTNTVSYSWASAMATAGQATILNAAGTTLQIIYSADGTDTLTLIATNSYGADTTHFYVTVFDCGSISQFPYTEPFETDNPCWLPVYGDGDPSVNTMGVTTETGYSLSGPHGGSSVFRFSSYSTSSDYNQYLISPELNGANLVLNFWAANYGSSDHLWIGFSSTTRDTAAFTWDSVELSLQSTDWTEFTYNLPVGTKFVGFHYYGNYAYYVYLDDLTIDGINVCAMPEITSIDREESSLTVNFTSEADSVDLIIVAGQQFNENAASVIATGNSYTFTGLTHSTIYTIGLRSLCNSVDFSEWNVVVDSTLTVNCGIPTALAVESTGYTSVTLSWTAAGEEHGWEVMVCNTIDTIHATSTTTTATVNGLMASTTYNAFVRALCGQNADIEGDWSAPIQLTTNSCAPVTDVTVSNVTFTAADVSWTAPEGATSFRVLYGLHDFTQGEELGTYTVNESQYHLTGLEIITDYTVRIANLCTETVVSQYASANFTTVTGGIATVDAEGNLSIYPNPASSMVTISVSEQLAGATATVVDLNGRTVASFDLTDNTATFDVSSLAKGAYFVRITGEQATTVRKLIVK